MARSDWGIGLVGLGGIAQTHLEGYRRQGLKVIGGADVDPNRIAFTEDRFDLQFTSTDYREIIDHPEVKVVDITVPHNSLEARLPIVEYAAARGKAIFIQKPLMPYLEWAQKLVEAAEKHGAPMMVNQNSVFAPGFMVAERFMRDPECMGKLYYCQIENRAWVNPGPERWYGKDKRWVHADMAIHHFALIRHWFGEVESVYAILAKDGSQQYVNGDTVGAVSVRFKSGMLALVINNWCYRGNRPRPHSSEEVIVQGERGSITCTAQEVHVKLADGRELRPEVKGRWFPDAFGIAMAHFIDALDSGRPFLCDARDNLRSVAMIEATYISAAENRPVFLDEILDS
jgi:predicted dehydrogenase